MGTYTYLLRKKTIPVEINGARYDAHCFSYNNRSSDEEEPVFLSNDSPTAKRRRKSIKRKFTIAENVFNNENFTGTVILCDDGDHPAGKPVYVNVSKHFWYDTEEFPGKLVGWIEDKPRGPKGFYLTDETPWSGCWKTAIGEEGLPVEFERRSVVDSYADNGLREERRFILPCGGKTRSLEIAIKAHRDHTMAEHISKSIDAAAENGEIPENGLT